MNVIGKTKDLNALNMDSSPCVFFLDIFLGMVSGCLKTKIIMKEIMLVVVLLNHYEGDHERRRCSCNPLLTKGT